MTRSTIGDMAGGAVPVPVRDESNGQVNGRMRSGTLDQPQQ